MKGFYDTLVVRYNACPPGCSACEEACVKRNAGDGRAAAIKAVHIDDVNFHTVIVCNQCSEPECKKVCPTGAITKNESSGVVAIKEEKCVGCGLCTLACPYGGVFYEVKRKKAVKCDYCEGQPVCVEACPEGILSFAKSSSVLGYLHEVDLAPKGVSLCAGCGTELAIRFMLRILGKEIVLFITASCVGPGVSGMGLLGGAKVAQEGTLFWSAAPTAAGLARYYQKLGREVTPVVLVGDGATADIGFGALSACAERGEHILYICNDNEAYMNTGIQRSSTTPFGSWSTTTPVGGKGKGKERVAKNVPLLMAMHGIPYAATATIAYLEDFAQKLLKAKEALKRGLAYIHLLNPCATGWRAPNDSVIELSRMAVETNYFPLWEADRGKFRITHTVKKVKPISEFTRLMGRFSHLDKEQIGRFQAIVDSRFAFLQALTGVPIPE